MEHIYESELLVSHSGARGRSSRGCLRGPDFVEQLLSFCVLGLQIQ